MSWPVIAGGKRYVAPLKAEALPFAIPHAVQEFI